MMRQEALWIQKPCLLEQWSAETGHETELHCFDNGDSLINETCSEKYDIIFLDIVMPP